VRVKGWKEQEPMRGNLDQLGVRLGWARGGKGGLNDEDVRKKEDMTWGICGLCWATEETCKRRPRRRGANKDAGGDIS